MSYKNITLVTRTKIIEKIFRLVCVKLDVNIKVLDNDANLQTTDILVYDDDLFDTNHFVRYKSASSQVAVIAKEKIYEYKSCFFIKKPFLPSELEKYLSELININNEENKENNTQSNEFLESNVDDLVDFIDSIDKEEDENFEQINIPKEELGNGGVLDKEELGILHEMINNDNIDYVEDDENNDWSELSDIIDKAIDDVQEYDFNDSNEELLVLNRYSLEELRPLLSKFNQNTIDKLSSGDEITLKLVLKNK